MAYDSKRLRGEIVAHYGTVGALTEKIGMCRSTMSQRLKTGNWRQVEIIKISELLDIPPQKIHYYFFADAVAEKPTRGRRRKTKSDE